MQRTISCVFEPQASRKYCFLCCNFKKPPWWQLTVDRVKEVSTVKLIWRHLVKICKNSLSPFLQKKLLKCHHTESVRPSVHLAGYGQMALEQRRKRQPWRQHSSTCTLLVLLVFGILRGHAFRFGRSRCVKRAWVITGQFIKILLFVLVVIPVLFGRLWLYFLHYEWDVQCV